MGWLGDTFHNGRYIMQPAPPSYGDQTLILDTYRDGAWCFIGGEREAIDRLITLNENEARRWQRDRRRYRK